MTVWTDNRRALWAGISNLQYRMCLTCAASREAAASQITGFFRSHGAVPRPADGGDGQTMTFTRGYKWSNRLARLLPWSKRWPHQTITVEFTPLPQSLVVKVGYDVGLSFVLAVMPNLLTEEVRELQGLLQSQ